MTPKTPDARPGRGSGDAAEALALRTAGSADAASIAAIYNHYIETTVVTFETEPVSRAEMAGRIDEVLAAGLPWLVAARDTELLGFAYASRWKGRCAYRFACETTVYLDRRACGRGIGSALYRELLQGISQRGMHAAIGGIALPNAASVALHEKLGFEQVAQFREVGYKFERWIDVGYWQLLLPASDAD